MIILRQGYPLIFIIPFSGHARWARVLFAKQLTCNYQKLCRVITTTKSHCQLLKAHRSKPHQTIHAILPSETLLCFFWTYLYLSCICHPQYLLQEGFPAALSHRTFGLSLTSWGRGSYPPIARGSGDWQRREGLVLFSPHLQDLQALFCLPWKTHSKYITFYTPSALTLRFTAWDHLAPVSSSIQEMDDSSTLALTSQLQTHDHPLYS